MSEMMNIEEIKEIEQKIAHKLQQIDEKYLQLGKLYYVNNEQNLDEMTHLCQEIDTINEHIAQYEKELLVLKGIVICPTCDYENPDSATFCLKCGTKLIKTIDDGKHCTNCGADLMEGQLYCTRCGTKVFTEQEASCNQVDNNDCDDDQITNQVIKQCSNCGAEIKEGQTFCTHCGKPVDDNIQVQPDQTEEVTLLCPHCQSPIQSGQKFCVVCGNQLNKVKPETQLQGQVKVCPNCGLEINGDKDKCDICGASLNSHIQNTVCPKCGKPYQPGQSFCTGCGTKLS